MSEAFIEGADAPEPAEDDLTPQPAPDEDDEGEGEPEEDEGEEKPAAKAVDWEKRAHHKEGLAAKERSRRRAAERQVADLAARIEALESSKGGDVDELTDLIGQLRDDDDEPITDLAQIKRVLKTFMARQEAEAKEERDRANVIGKVKTISTHMDAYEQDFAADHPDYFKAAAHYRTAREQELQDLGYAGDRLMRKLATEFYSLAEEVMASGRDPAEVVYGLAKKRGFASGKDAANAKLQKLQKAENGAVTPRGKGADNGLSWGDVAKLKGAARDAAFAKLRARELGKT